MTPIFMRCLRLILGFAPWLAFLVLARGGRSGLHLGLLVGLGLSVAMGVARLHRGIILWTGLVFFSLASLTVVGFHNVWTARHMGILAIGRPFTLDYAREQTDPSLWNDPAFLRTNRVLTATWGLTFTINALLAVGKLRQPGSPPGIRALCDAAASGNPEVTLQTKLLSAGQSGVVVEQGLCKRALRLVAAIRGVLTFLG
jgi:hypothetical protein